MLPNSISEHIFFKNFLGGHAPDPPSISMLIVLCTIGICTSGSLRPVGNPAFHTCMSMLEEFA